MRECLEQRRAESEATLKTANESILTAVGHWDTDAKFASQTRQQTQFHGNHGAKARIKFQHGEPGSCACGMTQATVSLSQKAPTTDSVRPTPLPLAD